MTNKVVAFKSAFDNVILRGLHSFWDGNNDFISLENYKEILNEASLDEANNIEALAPGIKGEAVYQII